MINHGFVSTKPDSPDVTIVGSSKWNADHIISGGNLGALVYQGVAGAPTLINSVVAGKVLTSNGAGVVPTWEDPSVILPIAESDVTGLVADLAAKAELPIAQADVTNLVADLASKAVLPITQADVTGLVAALAARLLRAPAVGGTTTSTVPAPNADTMDAYSLTAQATAAAFVNPSGTPVNFQKLTIRIKDDGTARALTWDTAYVAGGVALPTTTVISKIMTIGFIYNTDNGLNKWQCVAVAQEA